MGGGREGGKGEGIRVGSGHINLDSTYSPPSFPSSRPPPFPLTPTD